MRRIKLVVAVLAMLVVMVGSAVPAMARTVHFDNDDHDNGFIFDHDNGFFGSFDQRTDETGDVDLNSEIVNTGNNSNQTAAPLQFGNTGNFQNAQGFAQFGSSADDIEFDGGSFDFSPRQGIDSNQGVFQSAVSD